MRKIVKTDGEYPADLKEIYAAPDALYINGSIKPEDRNAVAVVGTRRASYYGLAQCEKLAFELALMGITVVSGMARGIDSAAHTGALRAGGRTIAVLGSGHGNIYPPENRKLYREIAKTGAVVSEFPDETPPLRGNFPKRNRIISGMSKGVVVVEAARRSGALITANFALEQGREVFAMPGNVNSSRSAGTNTLIKDGARLAENARDIIEELKEVLDICDTGLREKGSMRPDAPVRISETEKALLNALGDKPRPIDELKNSVGLPPSTLHEALLRLEMKKLIRTLPGENIARCI